MTLDEYIASNNLTDESFGRLIGRSRMQVYRYRHGLAVPRKGALQSIYEVTEGKVPVTSFYQ